MSDGIMCCVEGCPIEAEICVELRSSGFLYLRPHSLRSSAQSVIREVKNNLF